MLALGAALATRSGTTLPSSAGSQRSPLSAPGPATQPSATLMWSPWTLNTRPVMSFDSGLPSQTTMGAMLAGSNGSNSSGFFSVAAAPMPRFSVMRVSAAGAMAFTVTP